MSTRKRAGQWGGFLYNRPGFSPKIFRKLWRQNVPISELAKIFRVSEAIISATAVKLKCEQPNVQQDELDMEWQPNDPTLEEIAERAADIRARWSDDEKIRRAGGTVKSYVVLKHYAYDGRTASFSNCAGVAGLS